jgi:hypothetical protein
MHSTRLLRYTDFRKKYLNFRHKPRIFLIFLSPSKVIYAYAGLHGLYKNLATNISCLGSFNVNAHYM